MDKTILFKNNSIDHLKKKITNCIHVDHNHLDAFKIIYYIYIYIYIYIYNIYIHQ